MFAPPVRSCPERPERGCGVPLLTVKTEANGDSLSTFERDPCLVRWACQDGIIHVDFCPALAALVSPVKNIIFLIARAHY